VITSRDTLFQAAILRTAAISPTAGSGISDVTSAVGADLRRRLDLSTCRFEPFPFDALLPRIEPGRIVIPAAEPVTASYASWRPEHGVELPVRYGQLTLGRFVLVPKVATCGIAIPAELRADAIAIAQSVGDELGRRWSTTHPARER
jgi:hypothetical protein